MPLLRERCPIEREGCCCPRPQSLAKHTRRFSQVSSILSIPYFALQVVVDAVCSVASEELRFDDWDLDVVLTASQKGLGTPPGLSILVASQRALDVR